MVDYSPQAVSKTRENKAKSLDLGLKKLLKVLVRDKKTQPVAESSGIKALGVASDLAHETHDQNVIPLGEGFVGDGGAKAPATDNQNLVSHKPSALSFRIKDTAL